jgi:lipopolysaccharide/colanic/teichoic acid biosynthesis glycosyltransferase
VAPKIKGLQWFYFALTDGRNRVLSKAEVLGRLHYCGFHVVKMEEVDNRLHLIMKKAKPPSTDPEPSYRLIYKKKIPGQHGKIIHIYKVRTMYPFSEYLRDFMLRRNGYATAGAGIGKIDHDFRITGWGRFLRKHWIDELPQVINILKGELKIVGIRPLSESFLAEYPPDFAAERAKFKTGLLPPYAAHIHKSIQEYIDSERKYLAAYQKHPFWTDFRYFFWIIYNILSNKIRSQ